MVFFCHNNEKNLLNNPHFISHIIKDSQFDLKLSFTLSFTFTANSECNSISKLPMQTRGDQNKSGCYGKSHCTADTRKRIG